MSAATGKTGLFLENPPWITALFSNTEFAWVWLLARVYLGVRWLDSGWDKLDNPAWTSTGLAVKGFWVRAIAIPETGRPPIAYDWYRQFLQVLLENDMHGIFGKLIAYGEVAVGLGLIVGCLTGIAALFGVLMNMNYLLAGTASVNPVLAVIGLGVMVAWKTAGWWGLDRWVLPMVGAPWQKGTLFGGERPVLPGQTETPKTRYIEEWVRIIAAAVLAAVALEYLRGYSQMLLVAVAIVLAGLTGFGMLFVTPAREKR